MAAPELTQCHDCSALVSFTALACPHCGSREPSGPYRFTKRETRRFRIEERNDRRLILMTAGLAAIGVFYGLETSSSTVGAVITTTLYGFLGAAIGAPLAFAINVTRHWR
jgi:hypothetical protein